MIKFQAGNKLILDAPDYILINLADSVHNMSTFMTFLSIAIFLTNSFETNFWNLDPSSKYHTVAKQKQGGTIYFCQLLRWYLVIWSDVHSKALFSGSSQYWPVILAGWILLLMLRECAKTFWPEDFRWTLLSKLCKLEIGTLRNCIKSTRQIVQTHLKIRSLSAHLFSINDYVAYILSSKYSIVIQKCIIHCIFELKIITM